MSTLLDIIANEEELLKEAALALPHQFTKCTYSLGYIRQAVYLCLTCDQTRGICSACSIACHTDHEQVELFPKRHFRCDCPTTSLPHPCTLHKNPEVNNEENTYGPNFKVVFCRCGRAYDALTERETMIQCLACEDWFHESCLNLRERPSSREGTPFDAVADEGEPEVKEGEQEVSNVDYALSEASSSGLPPPLIPGSKYESLVCAACVAKIDTLKKYAGSPGVLMVVRDQEDQPWKVLEREKSIDVVMVDSVEETRRKRSRSPSNGEPDSKRVKVDSEGSGVATHDTSVEPDLNQSQSPANAEQESKRVQVDEDLCLAPDINPVAQAVFRCLDKGDQRLGAGDLFLTEGFRERWCQCHSCSPALRANPYLLGEEETYEPPEDPDSGRSLEELGLRALQHIPRDRAIDGIHAFSLMRDDLIQYLRPFAAEGKEVSESDVQAFFDARREGKTV